MQDDLQTYAASEKANQRAVDIRMDMLNKLLAFYQAAEEQISGLEMQLMHFQLEYPKLLMETQKLIYWCQLHGVNIFQPMLYSITELEQLIIRGRKFRVVQDGHAIDQFNTIEALRSKEYADYLSDDHKFYETLFHANTKFRYLTKTKQLQNADAA
ncbi:MAG: hypothetical protein EOP45_17570 [Sphingobacteriaceae bacterium]|nr:MAG: hypothetical protein EOP45_17570 [Sphingobacteriaceae bacterium]